MEAAGAPLLVSSFVILVRAIQRLELASEFNRMAVSFEEVRKIALSLQNVVESTSYGTAAFKAGGKLLARLREDGDSLVMGTTFEEREEMMSEEPDIYYITEHYRNYPWVLVRLSRANAEAVRDLFKRALRLASAKPQRGPGRRMNGRSRRSAGG